LLPPAIAPQIRPGRPPKGRLAEDGQIPERYQLKETPNPEYAQRTEWNARDSDGTVVFSINPTLSGGSKITVVLAQKHGRPVLHLSRESNTPSETLLAFIQTNHIRVLNVAGSRASEEPGVGEFVKTALAGSGLAF
jgi:hypothetical protein